MFDLFAARYGWTLDYFYSLTLRQIFHIKEALENGKNTEFSQQAALHDKKLKDTVNVVKVSKEDKPLYKKKEDELMEKLKKRHKEAIKNGKRSRTTD